MSYACWCPMSVGHRTPHLRGVYEVHNFKVALIFYHLIYILYLLLFPLSFNSKANVTLGLDDSMILIKSN